MATEELSSFHGKKRNVVDAENLLPYLVLVTVTAFHELYQMNKDKENPYIADRRTDGFRVRLILMEHFTVHRTSMAIHDYSFVTFKQVEQQILQANVAEIVTYDQQE